MIWITVWTICVARLTSCGARASIIDNEEGEIAKYLKTSYPGCIRRCEDSLKCHSLKYYRLYNLCKLFQAELLEQAEKSSEFYVYRKATQNFIEHQYLYAKCEAKGADVTSTCKPTSCPQRHIHGATTLGNSLAVGSVVRYECKNIVRSETSTCLHNGTWTPVNLACLCRESATFSFQIISSNSTHITTNRKCPDGTMVIQTVEPTCTLATGEWQSVNLSCCETGNQQWQKVFRLSAGSQNGIVSLWLGKHGDGDFEFFMRSPLLNSWESLNPTRVKMQVVKNDAVVAFMEYNACNTGINGWLAHNRLLNSSWSSLNKDSTVDIVSLVGAPSSRFLVSQLYETTGDICNINRGWFVATKIMNQYCDFVRWTDILYAPGDDPIFYKDMVLADHLVIWLKV